MGNYRLLRTIGKGNFAKVKLARHILTGREVSEGTGAAGSQACGTCALWAVGCGGLGPRVPS